MALPVRGAHGYLPETIGEERAARLLERGRGASAGGAVAIPLEFADAAYRFGHGPDARQLPAPAGRSRPQADAEPEGFRPTPADYVVHWPLQTDANSWPA